MRDVDFLPVEYRQTHAVRRWQPWRVIVMLVAGTLIFAGVTLQYQRRHRLQTELAQILPAHEAAQRRSQRLAELQGELQRVHAEAQLCVYLRHPWPRTRILEALLEPLPEAVSFEQLQIQKEARTTKNAVRPVMPAAVPDKEAEKALAAQPAAARDLKQLSEASDAQQTIVALGGLTTDADALHRYLGRLAQSPLFAKAEIVSIERDSGERGEVLRFRASLIVKPGYGQTGGPSPAPAASAAKSTLPAAPNPPQPVQKSPT
jgi:Tfp pilus assembly protein PilN